MLNNCFAVITITPKIRLSFDSDVPPAIVVLQIRIGAFYSSTLVIAYFFCRFKLGFRTPAFVRINNRNMPERDISWIYGASFAESARS